MDKEKRKRFIDILYTGIEKKDIRGQIKRCENYLGLEETPLDKYLLKDLPSIREALEDNCIIIYKREY